MESTYSANQPEEMPPLQGCAAEPSVPAFSGTTSRDATCSSGPVSNNVVCRASVSVLNYKHAPDEQLVVAATSGDDQAFVELTSRYRASLQRKMFRILRNHEDAEDAVQEALFKAYAHLGQFRGACKFSTWLMRIGINSALMQLRRRRSHSELPLHQRRDDDQVWESLEIPDPSPNAEQLYAQCQTIAQLSCAAQSLPSSYRTMVREYHMQERPMRDTAADLGITVSAAKSRLLRARLAIRSILENKRSCNTEAYF